jgi:signal transduction histidine kinase
MGFAEILGNEYFGPMNPRQKDYTGGIREAGQRLVGLIDDILDLSTIEAGYMELEKAAVPVAETLKGLYTLTLEWARKEGIEVALECPANIGAVFADERRLKQALLNLIRNAITFTPQGGKILIRAGTVKGRTAQERLTEISVSDTGPGIPAADQERVFEPFARGHESGKTGALTRGGAGLGLTLVKNIVEMHGGHIRLTSLEGEGTTMTVVLPAG